MNNETKAHPARGYTRDVLSVTRSAYLTISALAMTIAVRIFDIGAVHYQNSVIAQFQLDAGSVTHAQLEFTDELVSAGAIGQLLLLFVTAGFFLSWVRKLTRTSKDLGAIVPWSPKDAVTGFFIPIVNFKRPYEVLKSVHDALSPDLLPAPTVRLEPAADGGYRDIAVVQPAPAVTLPHAAIGAWWAMFWVSRLLNNMGSHRAGATLDSIADNNSAAMVGGFVAIIAAALAIVMVRALSLRLQAWHQRVAEVPVETLATLAIVIEPKLD